MEEEKKKITRKKDDRKKAKCWGGKTHGRLKEGEKGEDAKKEKECKQ